jgi:hypothetical protein
MEKIEFIDIIFLLDKRFCKKMNANEQSVVLIQRAWRSALRKSLIPICFHCYTREGSGWKKAEVKKQHITRYIDECGECGNILGFLCYCCDG